MDNFDNEEPEVDNGVLPFVSSDDSDETDEIETRDDEDKSGEGETPESGETVEGEDGKAEITEKGTKLDPNPQSAVHQQLANEKRLRAQYEQVLADPALLRKYAKEAGMTLEEAKAEIKEEKKALYTPDRFKSAQDVADVLNELQGKSDQTIAALQKELQGLRGELSGISSSRQVERVASSMQSDIGSIQEKYPQLNPKSPEYDKNLEKDHELDAIDPSNPNSGYKGQFSLAKIAERFMRVRGVGAKEGSQRAQTIVKTKMAGKVVTSSKNSSKDTTSSDPGTSIAQKIQKALQNN